MKKNILVTGSKGQLGSELRELSEEYKQYNFFFTSKAELDITRKSEVEDFLASHRINVIINCAAYTAVDKAEEEFELADQINHTGVKHLADIAKKVAIQLIHISTDYVFDGENFKPYGENDSTSPVNKYGQTKLAGEESIIEAKLNNSMIIRTSWVYSSYGNNFVKTMLKLGNERKELKVVDDQIGTPTYARDLAEFILKNCLEKEHQGLETYHYTNEGVCSWYDFAIEIMSLSQSPCAVFPIPTSEFRTAAPRPSYSVMCKEKLRKEFNFYGIHWKQSLNNCLKKLEDHSH